MTASACSRKTLVAAAVLLGSGFPAIAGQIYNNLIEPGDRSSPAGVGIGHTPSFRPADIGQVFAATGFTPTGSFRLTSLEMPVVYVSPFPSNGPNQIDIFLADDVAGLPGNIIESWHLANLPTPPPQQSLTIASSVLHPLLLSDTPYWVYASGGLDTFDTWNLVPKISPSAGRSVFNGVDSGWLLDTINNQQTGLIVIGDPVPEPGNLPAMLLLLPLMLLRLRYRRSQPTVVSPAVATGKAR